MKVSHVWILEIKIGFAKKRVAFVFLNTLSSSDLFKRAPRICCVGVAFTSDLFVLAKAGHPWILDASGDDPTCAAFHEGNTNVQAWAKKIWANTKLMIMENAQQTNKDAEMHTVSAAKGWVAETGSPCQHSQSDHAEKLAAMVVLVRINQLVKQTSTSSNSRFPLKHSNIICYKGPLLPQY